MAAGTDTKSGQPAARAGQDAEPAAGAAQVEVEPHVEPLPERALSQQILYQMLLAEVAGQRGNLPLAINAYLDLAKSTRDPRIARRAAELAQIARQADAAVSAAQLWIEIDPAAVLPRQLIAGLFAAAGRWGEIEPHVAMLLAREPARVGDALLALNRLFGRNDDKKGVQGLVVKLTEPYLDHPEAHLARSQAAQVAGDDAVAIREAELALSARPDWHQAIMLKAHSQSRSDMAVAIETLRVFLEAHPKAREVRLQYARMLTSDKRFEEARSQFRSLLDAFPDNGDVIFAVGALSYQLKDYDTADQQFRRLIDMRHGDANTLNMYLGQIAENRGRPAEAIKAYEAVEPGDQYVPARVRAANVIAASGDLVAARRLLQQAAASNNRERVQLVLAEAQLLRDAGRAREAFELLDSSVNSQPNQPELLYESALLAERVGRLDVLETNLRKLIAIKPDHAHAYNALGYSLADRNERLDEAYQLIKTGLEYAPDDPFILDSMGWVMYRRGELQRSIEFLQRAMNLRPDPEIAAHLGEVLWALGRRDDAQRTWRDAEKAHPGNEVLTNAIKRFIP